MPIRSAPYYWLECDGDGCRARCPSANGDLTAWSDLEGAAAYAYDNGWLARGGSWLCPTCQLAEDGDGLTEIARISADADLYRKTDGVVIRREDGSA